jgi:hypothetical protein
MPVTISSRISKLTRTSWRPRIIRLPLGSTWVTIAAIVMLIVSERAVVPPPAYFEPELVSSAPRHRRRAASWRPGDAEQAAQAAGLGAAAGARGVVAEIGLVGDVDLDRQDIADLVRALIAEQRAGAGAEQRRARPCCCCATVAAVLTRPLRSAGIASDGSISGTSIGWISESLGALPTASAGRSRRSPKAWRRWPRRE